MLAENVGCRTYLRVSCARQNLFENPLGALCVSSLCLNIMLHSVVSLTYFLSDSYFTFDFVAFEAKLAVQLTVYKQVGSDHMLFHIILILVLVLHPRGERAAGGAVAEARGGKNKIITLSLILQKLLQIKDEEGQ